MTTPFIVKLMGEPSGTLKGKEQVGAYWRRALDRIPDLHFELVDVFAGVGSLVIHYKSVLGLLACEVFFFDGQGKVCKAVAHYSDNQRQGATGMDKVNLREKFACFTEPWKPKIVGELNGQQVKLVKFQGSFVWHHHEHEDELFLVVKGRFRMEFRDRHVWLEEGEFLIVPRGVEHRPVADEEAHVLLFEPASTLNTGNVQNERTVAHLDRI
jgi:mannose-6-phosphate isomerase-like protein (cupin superfamily)